jgi:hypothetical protein
MESDEVKTLHSRLLLSNVLKERKKQICQAQEAALQKVEQEKAFVAEQDKALQVTAFAVLEKGLGSIV